MRLVMPYYNQLVLPAYAGMIPPTRPNSRAVPRAPRVYGDDPQVHPQVVTENLCSPRMRG